MHYVSWNCRGLDRNLKEALKNIVRLYSLEIILIQETKMEDLALLQASKAFWIKGQGKAVSARGASGGIATFWDNSIYDLEAEYSSTHWLFTKILHKDSGHHVSLFNVYVPISPAKKRICWDSLKSYLSMHNPVNIIIAGDLNVTLAAEEKREAHRSEIKLENGLKT